MASRPLQPFETNPHYSYTTNKSLQYHYVHIVHYKWIRKYIETLLKNISHTWSCPTSFTWQTLETSLKNEKHPGPASLSVPKLLGISRARWKNLNRAKPTSHEVCRFWSRFCYDGKTKILIKIFAGWWFQPLWKIRVTYLGWLFPIYGKKNMFQTTNQFGNDWDLRFQPGLFPSTCPSWSNGATLRLSPIVFETRLVTICTIEIQHDISGTILHQYITVVFWCFMRFKPPDATCIPGKWSFLHPKSFWMSWIHRNFMVQCSNVLNPVGPGQPDFETMSLMLG